MPIQPIPNPEPRRLPEEKKEYETPRVIELGALSQGDGYCQSGTFGGAYCNTGSFGDNFTACTSGTIAP